MAAFVNKKKLISNLERQCESQMTDFERNFNYSHSQEVLRSILIQLEDLTLEISSEEHTEVFRISQIQLNLQLKRLQARVFECIGTIYLSLTLPNQSLSVLERASNIMIEIQEIKEQNQDQLNKQEMDADEKVQISKREQQDLKIIARILIKTSYSLFLKSESKQSYRYLTDAHSYIKQNNLLDSEEEALLNYYYGNFYRFIFQDELSERCFLKCISIREKIFGQNSATVYDAKQELAKLYIESAQLNQAQQLVDEVFKYKINEYGESCPCTSLIYLYRASLLFVISSNVDDALKDVLKSIQINTLYIGEYNKINAECYLLLGKILAKKYPSSRNFEKKYYYSNPQANCQQLNAPFAFQWNQYKSNANDFQSSPISSSSSSYSSSNFSSKQSSSNSLSSQDYTNQNFLNLQKLQFNKYVQQQFKDSNMTNFCSESANNFFLSGQGQTNEEIELFQIYFNKALHILKTLFGEYNGCIGIAYNAIGKVHMSLKQYEKALNCFNASIEIFKAQKDAQDQINNNNSNEFNFFYYFAVKYAADCNMKLGRLKTAHSLYQLILQIKDTLNLIFNHEQADNDLNEKQQLEQKYNQAQKQQDQQPQQIPFTLSIMPTTQSILLNSSQSIIEDEHKKLFVSPIDINSQQIIELLNQSKTED
ncbi:hypothetical protein ABPG74_006999 [Tetrahymena malaccensis]